MTFEEWYEENEDAIEDAPRTEGAYYSKTTHEWAWNAALDNQWQPIETAHHEDDEEILGWQRGLGVCVCRWSDEHQCFVMENDCGEVEVSITHFMPIPKPPNEEPTP